MTRIAHNRKTPKEFESELRKMRIPYRALDRYCGAKTKIRFECMTCGHIWKSTPTNILSGRGCPECRDANNKKRFELGEKEFRKRISEINPDIELIHTGDPSWHGRSMVRCKKHGVIWDTINSALLRGCGCRECMREKIANKNGRSSEEFVKLVRKTSPHIEVLGEYKNARTKIKVRCKTHDEIYYVTPDLLLHGTGNCPKCTMTSGEYKVANYLDSKGYEYIAQHSFKGADRKIRNKRFDFYIPDMNTCIEYDGIQHFEPVGNFGGEETFEYTKKNDALKNKFCDVHGIKLIRVPYTENDVGAFLEANGI